MLDEQERAAQGCAVALYAMIFAPLGEHLGMLGNSVVEAAAQACARPQGNDLVAYFARCLHQAEHE